jgi:uncharacterized glyoxalase superfamily protein PhnB
MKFTSLIPMLYTKEVKDTIDFYIRILGFQLDEYNEDWGWASLHRDDVAIMIASPNEHIAFDKPTFTGSFYIQTDDVDYWWEQLKHKVNLCYGVDNFEYGMREFAFYDNNGYLLQMGRPIEDQDNQSL